MTFKHTTRSAVRWLFVAVLAGLIVSVSVVPGCKRQTPTKPTEPVEPPISVVPVEPVYEPQFGLEAYPTEHYLLYSSAPEHLKADVAMRLEAHHAALRKEMADVFTPSADKAKAFFIGDPELFVKAGGEPHAPGVFRVLVDQNGNWADSVGPRLVLRNFGDAIYLEITSLMQHEGWHQFNWHHVRKWAPIWLDEGLAHYYQYSVWTGDTTIHGGIHGVVYQNLMQCAPAFTPVRELLTFDDNLWRAWQGQVGFWPPYMESWSLIHFLKYADGGVHEPVFKTYLADVVAGRDTTESGGAIAALEGRWLQWLQSLQPTSTHGKFFEGIAAMLAGHLARCHINGQDFDSMASFLAAADAGELELGEIGSETWLPASVMGECKRYLQMYGQGYAANGMGPFEVEIEMVGDLPTARVRLPAIGMDLHGVATVSGGRVTGVTVRGLETIQPGMR